MADVARERRFTITPNPSSGLVKVTIDLRQEESDWEIKVLNLTGLLVRNAFSDSSFDSITVELTDLPVGVYDVVLSLSGLSNIVEHEKLVVVK